MQHTTSLQIGLYSTAIATIGIRKILACLDTTVPSERGLQKRANIVGPIVTEENINDMAKQRSHVKRTLKY